jgi:hypothetical protein
MLLKIIVSFYLNPKICILNTSSNIPRYNGLFTVLFNRTIRCSEYLYVALMVGWVLKNEMELSPSKES